MNIKVVDEYTGVAVVVVDEIVNSKIANDSIYLERISRIISSVECFYRVNITFFICFINIKNAGIKDNIVIIDIVANIIYC